MKIYVNTNKIPATLNASTSAKTDAEGVLKVYSSTLANEIATLALKRAEGVSAGAAAAPAARDEGDTRAHRKVSSTKVSRGGFR